MINAMTADISYEIQTEYLQNTNLQSYRLDSSMLPPPSNWYVAGKRPDEVNFKFA
jgi:hypothetical protein